jgi:VanZ family protein
MLKDYFTNTKYQSIWQIIFWLVFLTLLGLTLSPELPRSVVPIEHIDKLYHFIAFAGFAFIFCMAYPSVGFLWSIGLSSLLGLGIEIVQDYIPGRSFSWWDMLADCAGILMGCYLVKALRSYSCNNN